MAVSLSSSPASVQHRQSFWLNVWRHRIDYAFIAPFFIVFGLFHLYPLLWAIWLSFNRWSGFGPMSFVGLTNYTAVIADDAVRKGVVNTLIFAAVLVPSGVLLSLSLAVALNIRDLKARGILRTIYFLPFITSTVIVAIVFEMLFDNTYGWINDALRMIHLAPISWFASIGWARVMIIVLATWQGLGYNILIMLGGLQGIEREVYEAAAIDGAGRWNAFWSVTVPLMRPVMLFVTVIGTIGVLNMFTQPYLLTQGGPENGTLTMTLRLYQLAFADTLYGNGAALGVLLGLLIVGVTMVQLRLLRSWRQ